MKSQIRLFRIVLKGKLTRPRSLLNSAFAVSLLLLATTGCNMLNFKSSSLENTKWTGSITESSVTVPITFDILPQSKAFVGITLPGAPAPVYFPTTWTKSGDVITLKWNEGSFTGTVKDSLMSGNMTGKDGRSFLLDLHKE